MQRHYIFTILTLIQIVAVLVLALPASAQDTGSLAGSVFVDGNGNALAEPGEAAVSGAIVYLRSQANPKVEFTAQTNANGYFLLRDIPYDVYQLWATAPDQSGFHLLTAEVDEANAQVVLDVPVSEVGVSPAQSKTLYLPLVSSGT